MEDVERFARFRLLLEQIAESVDCFLSLLLLRNQHVACIFKIGFIDSSQSLVLNKRLHFLRPIAEDVGETLVKSGLQWRKQEPMMASLR